MKIKLNKKQWQSIGKTAGWIKMAQPMNQSQFDYYRSKNPQLINKTNEEISELMRSDNGLNSTTQQKTQPQLSRVPFQNAINAYIQYQKTQQEKNNDKSKNQEIRNKWLQTYQQYMLEVQNAKKYYSGKKWSSIINENDPTEVISDISDNPVDRPR